MNDIEVLKSTLEKYCYKNCKGEIDKKCSDCERLKAIENLLNRIKDLEEINEAHKKENGELRERVKDLQKSVDQIYEDYQDIGKMYFNLTEKIEKKIEELKPINFDTADDRDYIIEVLEELLKGE